MHVYVCTHAEFETIATCQMTIACKSGAGITTMQAILNKTVVLVMSQISFPSEHRLFMCALKLHSWWLVASHTNDDGCSGYLIA